MGRNVTREKKIMITGVAGFIGFHLAKRLSSLDFEIAGIDNLNPYYDPRLKLDRLRELGFSSQQIDAVSGNEPIRLKGKGELAFYKVDLGDRERFAAIFGAEKPDYVVHLAAQAGVRYSLENPYAYIQSNIAGFLNVLENCRHQPVKHLVFASSSSVYGANERMPFSEHHNVDHPISLYAATKKSSELMAHTYAHLYHIPCTGLRFFTVYGPWGRPDMATFIFTHKIYNNIPIEVYNHGNMERDFTYIDDIVEGIYRVMLKIPGGNDKWDGLTPDPASSKAPYLVFNIGNHRPVNLRDFIAVIEQKLSMKASIKFLPRQEGDVLSTYADIDALYRHVGFKPVTPIEQGISNFVDWYLGYYGNRK
jgi:UDP-glucuronate 4-epimerase